MTKEERRREEEFKAKYQSTIRQIAITENCDMGVAFAMLTYEIRVRLGIQKRQDTYKGIPESFDWEAAKVDYNELIKK